MVCRLTSIPVSDSNWSITVRTPSVTGCSGIITLIDAQTQSLVADLAAADAAYDYMLALLFVDREISHFRNLDDTEAQRDFERRLNEFVLAADAAQSVAPPPP